MIQIPFEVEVTIEPDYYTLRSANNHLAAGKPELAKKVLDSWIKNFEAFLRDHRSQDCNGLTARIVYKWKCETCGALHDEDTRCCS